MPPKTRHEACQGDKALVHSIASAMRKVWHRHKNREAIADNLKYAIQEYNKDGKPKARLSHFWDCQLCGQKCKQAKSSKYPRFHIDHVDPVIPLDSEPITWDTYIDRLFFSGQKNLKLICEPCHKEKTREETRIRADARRRQLIKKR